MDFEKLNLDIETKEAIWVPPELKKQISQASKEENYVGVWRYIAMLHNNYQVLKSESKKK